MSLTRAVLVVLCVLATMLAVVVVRAEATRTHHRISRLDARADALRQELRVRQIELARLTNPALIWSRVRQLTQPDPPPAAPPKPPAPVRRR